jgi:transcriptional/translational regulatory protein YebC/TACO1
LGEAGCVNWMFSKKGIITLPKNTNSEDLENRVMEIALEAGAEDIQDQEGSLEVVTSFETLEEVRKKLEGLGISVESSVQTLIPQNTIELIGENAEKMLKLIDLLEDLDDVQKVHSNFDLSEEEALRLS